LCYGTILSNAQQNIRIGIGFEIFHTPLKNVANEIIDNNGQIHSRQFSQNKPLGYGLNFLVNKPLPNSFSIETGIGVSNYRNQFVFTDLENYPIHYNLSLYYIKIPLMFSFQSSWSKKSSINIAAGIQARFLLNWTELYKEQVNLPDIGLPRDQFHFFNLSPQLAIGYNYKLKNNNIIRLESFAGLDLLKMKKSGDYLYEFGFYKNLTTAAYNNYGLAIKYLF